MPTQSKTHIAQYERTIAKKKRELQKTKEKKTAVEKNWAAKYAKFLKDCIEAAKIARGTKRHKFLSEKVNTWPQRSAAMTTEKYKLGDEIKKIEEEIQKLSLELTILKEKTGSEIEVIDEIVTQVFSLNDVAVQASENRRECLNRYVFPRLIGSDGKLNTRISFTAKDGLRRVVALVNSMTIIQGDFAREAKMEIEKFFSRFTAVAMNATTKALFDLTRALLIEKTSFKVGPDLYRFLGMSLDENVFPELSSAQQLLRLSIRSEKTNSYIRIYRRRSMTDKWEVVPQS